jgi:hypothetical protein
LSPQFSPPLQGLFSLYQIKPETMKTSCPKSLESSFISSLLAFPFSGGISAVDKQIVFFLFYFKVV